MNSLNWIALSFTIFWGISSSSSFASTPQAIEGVKDWLRQELLSSERAYPIESGVTRIQLHQARSFGAKTNPYQVVLEIRDTKADTVRYFRVPHDLKSITGVSVREGAIMVFARIQSETDWQMSDQILKIRFRDLEKNALMDSVTSEIVVLSALPGQGA